MAEAYSYNENHTVIGAIKTDLVDKGDSLIEIARRYGLGYNAITEANPTLDPFVPGEDSDVVIPTSWILPDAGNYSGIVINISEMRLYFFHQRGKTKLVETFPIGIGTEGAETPAGQFSVVQKMTNPSWHPPASIRKERPELPEVVPPGPDNPLGSHALRLSHGSILIHGTNRPFAVGRKASHGCIRMYPEDIPELYEMTPRGTRVSIVRQPVKVGVRDRKVYIEVHKDEYQSRTDYSNEAVRLLTKKGLLKNVNTEKMYQAVQEKRGMPVDISN
ncbi:MAG TPA: L,D-transpeptidase family protein [Thermodesulfovibrionales bacterium]|nr:L,D-transpeptidase family protein [Thermodesulfovibrionales bacterium]